MTGKETLITQNLERCTFKEIAESNDFNSLEEQEEAFVQRAKVGDPEGDKCQRFLDETGMVNLARE